MSYSHSPQQANPQTPLTVSPEAALSPEERWLEEIRPDFVQGNSIIAGAKKLIDAKRALKSATARSSAWSSERETPDA
jgi:hypothetical protein